MSFEGQWTPIDLQFMNHLWVPNIFIYDLRSFNALNVLKKLAGIWIIEGKQIYFSQGTFINYVESPLILHSATGWLACGT